MLATIAQVETPVNIELQARSAADSNFKSPIVKPCHPPFSRTMGSPLGNSSRPAARPVGLRRVNSGIWEALNPCRVDRLPTKSEPHSAQCVVSLGILPEITLADEDARDVYRN